MAAPSSFPRRAVFTVCTASHLARALVMFRSFRGEADRYLILAERDPGAAVRADIEARSGARLVSLGELAVPSVERMAFHYDAFEFTTALRPVGFRHLFEAGYDRIVYLDTDIEIYGPVAPLFDVLESADAAVTPHIDLPLPDDGCSPATEDVLRGGQFNSGFIALARTGPAVRFADWWAERLRRHSLFHPNHYFFVDQFYLAMIASFVPKLAIFRHPGANLAYWNILQRDPILADGGGITVRGAPLLFFHYSGFVPDDLPRLSRHQDRLRLPEGHPLLPVAAGYRDRLAAAEAELAHLDQGYSFAAYADGTPIPMADRRRLLLADPAAQAALADPFAGLGALADTDPVPDWPVPRADYEAVRRQAADLAAALAQLRQDRQAEAAASERLAADLRAALAAATKAYDAVLASTAWRLTAPLRAVLGRLRRG